jgi:hypothetical protein
MPSIEKGLERLAHEHERRQELDREIEELLSEFSPEEQERLIREVEEQCRQWNGEWKS